MERNKMTGMLLQTKKREKEIKDHDTLNERK